MNNDVSKLDIDCLYNLYGYEAKMYDGCWAYEYKHGRYFGVDIYPLEEDDTVSNRISDLYKSQNYAVNIRNNIDFDAIDAELFDAFFHTSIYNHLLLNQYKEYVRKIEERYGNGYKYKYINGNFREIIIDGYSDGTVVDSKDQKTDLVKEILSSQNQYKDKAMLTIIEAAAGFGKTCTAYELIRGFCETTTSTIPLYIELARNREARIFKHILQNEIDKQFQGVGTSDLIIHQIQKGRIPVIIDGFDELLSKDFENDAHSLRDIESMLSTILDLLDAKAKVIITSRKTAILSGDNFYNTISISNKKFYLYRVSLEAPTVEDWLTPKQQSIAKTYGFSFVNVANPVLLSFIRCMDDSAYLNIVTNKDCLVELYFSKLLEREKVRQQLYMKENEQRRVFRKLARLMCDFDIKAADKATIKDLIGAYNEDIFTQYIATFPTVPKPTHEDLAETFSNHALLDRNKDNLIGFVNDFILGIMVGENIVLEKFVEHYPDSYKNIVSRDFIELALLSYKLMPIGSRKILWDALVQQGYTLDDSLLFFRDVYLLGELKESQYSNIQIESISISDVTFGANVNFQSSLFSSVSFNNCRFRRSSFVDSGFVGCSFFNCDWEVEEVPTSYPYILSSYCNQQSSFVDDLYRGKIISNYNNDESEGIRDRILAFFFRSDGKVVGMRRIYAIKQKFNEYDDEVVLNAIEDLRKNELIVLNGGNCFIQRNGISYYNKNVMNK